MQTRQVEQTGHFSSSHHLLLQCNGQKTNEELEFMPKLLVGGGGGIWEKIGWQWYKWREWKGQELGFLRGQEAREMQNAYFCSKIGLR